MGRMHADERLTAGRIVEAVCSRPHGFLLDSPPGGHSKGNAPYAWRGGRMLFGVEPREVLRIDDPYGADALDRLDAFLQPLDRRKAAIAVGFLSYDLGGVLEPACALKHPPAAEPLVYFALFDDYFEHDPAGCSMTRVTSDGTRPVGAREIDSLLAVSPARLGNGFEAGAAVPDFTPSRYKAAVAGAREYILSGDIFEVNLSQRFTAQCSGETGALYMRLRERNPAPYAALVRCAGLSVLSSSPELFLRLEGGHALTRPIKGTARRASDPADDRRAAERLLASDKDNAELAMIIDLERNDLGRVCRYGTVRVVERARLETFARVHHLVSTVEGQLRDGVTLGGLLRATFPGGSITGAPKIRAMQIIDELEPCPRGVYTGAVGCVFPGGRAELNIAIRTIIRQGDRLSLHVGGAVTADSDPAAEYEETLAKAEAMLSALSGAQAAIAAREQGGEQDAR